MTTAIETTTRPPRGQAPLEYRGLARAHNRFRLVSTTILAASAAFVAFAWGWHRGYVVAGLAGMVAIDALRRIERPSASPVAPLVLDAFALCVGIALANPPPVAAIAPILTLLVPAVFFLPPRQAAAFILADVAASAGALALSPHLGGPLWQGSQATLVSVLLMAPFLALTASIVALAGRAVAEREKLAHALGESERRHRHLFERNPIPLVMIDAADGRIVTANPAAEELLARGSPLTGRPWVSFVGDPEAFGVWLTGRLPNATDPSEIGLVRTDGSTLLARVDARPVTLDHRRHHLVSIVDQSEREAARADAARADRRFRAAIDRSPLGIAFVNGGEIGYANPALAAILDTDPDGLIGQEIGRFVHPEHRARAARHLCGEAQASDDEPLVLVGARGREVVVECTVVPDESESGAIHLMVRDVTDRERARQALTESESRFRGLADSAPIGVFLADDHGRCLYVNRRMEELTALDAETLRTRSLFDRVHPADVPRIRDLGIRNVEKGIDFQTPLRLQLPDGSIRRVLLSAAPLSDASPRVWVGSLVDVTAEHEGREATRRLSTVLEATTDLVGITDADGRYVYVNPAATAAVGRDLVGTDWREIFDAASRHLIETEVIPTVARTGAWRGELVVDGVGGPIVTSFVFMAHRDEDGRISYFSGVARDITDVRAAAERLEVLVAEKERHLRHEHALSTCSRALLFDEDADALRSALSAILEATDASTAFVERNTPDDMTHLVAEVGREGIPTSDPERWSAVPWSAMPRAYARLSRGRFFAFRPEELDGSERDLYDGTPIRSELDVPVFVGGRWVGVIGLTDNREPRRWTREEIQLLRTAAQMIGAYWDRLDARRRLEDLVRSKDEFVAGVSHELRTPLTAVVGLANELRDGLQRFGPDETAEFVKLIADQSNEVANIVEDLLVAARVDIGKVTVFPERIDLAHQVEAVLSGWAYRTPTKVVADEVVAWADPVRVRQIVRNLLTNAIRYGGETIEVTVRACDDHAEIEVRDDGSGIPDDDTERVFAPYESAHDRRGQPTSVGLGLTVSRRLARLMDGDIVYERADGWTSFVLRLPLEAPHDGEAEGTQALDRDDTSVRRVDAR